MQQAHRNQSAAEPGESTGITSVPAERHTTGHPNTFRDSSTVHAYSLLRRHRLFVTASSMNRWYATRIEQPSWKDPPCRLCRPPSVAICRQPGAKRRRNRPVASTFDAKPLVCSQFRFEMDANGGTAAPPSCRSRNQPKAARRHRQPGVLSHFCASRTHIDAPNGISSSLKS
jgi:hypothetical protein